MSKVFCSFRALGLICNDIPLILRYNKFHNEYYISTIIGNFIHSYKLSNLGLKTVSCEILNILCLTGDKRHLYVSSANVVYSIIRGIDIKHTLSGSKSDIICLLPFEDFLIAANKDCEILLWHLDTQVLQTKLFVGPGKVTSLLHPFAYKNKILIGFNDGALQLWNISTCQLIHTFTSHLVSDSRKISVTVLEQAPALHVVAVGFCDGRVALLHLQEDNLIRDFQLDWGSVTSISFKHSSGSASADNSLLLVGSVAGHVTLWEVSSGRLVGELRHAHRSAVTGLVCVQGQSLLVSSAGDNALRVWLWDMGVEVPRMLHERAGHSAPPNVLLSLDANGRQLLSSGKDAVVREFSTVHDRYNRSFGRSAINRKQTKKLRREAISEERDRLADVMFLPEVTSLAGSLARAGDWDSLVATHLQDRRVSTWDVRRGCRGRYLLQPVAMLQDERRFKAAIATSVFVTSCGNFVLVGYSTGHIVRFNLQSGLERCVYPQKPPSVKGALQSTDSNLPLTESRLSLASKGKKTVALEWTAAHTAAVAGLACDALNRIVSSVGALGCSRLFFFHFKTGAPLGEPLPLGEAATLMELHRSAGYLVIALASGRLLLVDAFRRRVVRRLLGHSPAQLSAFALSPCTFQLLSAGTDGLLRLWDLLEGKVIDCFRVTSPATALLWLPQGDLVASCHRGELGVHLWTNRTAYEANLVLTALPEDYQPPQCDTVSLPMTMGSATLTDDDVEMQQQLDEENGIFDDKDIVKQLQPDFLTLSGQAESRVSQLLHLDDFRERGLSARDKVKASIEAPFFLPSGTEPLQETVKGPLTTALPPVLSSGLAPVECLLAQKLALVVAALSDVDVDVELSAALWEPILLWLESLAPSMLDAQLLDLSSCANLTRAAFLRCCSSALQAKRHFDTVSAYLATALRHWGASVAKEAAEDPILCRELHLVLSVETQVCEKFFRLSDDIEALLTIHQTGLLGLHLD